MVYFTRTGSPLCFPGFQLGMASITRLASASSSSLTLFTILILVMEISQNNLGLFGNNLGL